LRAENKKKEGKAKVFTGNQHARLEASTDRFGVLLWSTTLGQSGESSLRNLLMVGV
jgi:hypothetical protein